MAGVTWWDFYFRLFPGAIRSPVIEFLTHLLRPSAGQAADRLGWSAQSSQPAGLGVRAPEARAIVVGVIINTALPQPRCLLLPLLQTQVSSFRQSEALRTCSGCMVYNPRAGLLQA
jgi:hypothetical protein